MTRTNIAVGVVTALATLGVGSTMAQTAGAPKPATDSQHEQHHQSTQGLSDAEFVPMMIKHHRDGIQMAQLEEKNGASAEVKAWRPESASLSSVTSLNSNGTPRRRGRGGHRLGTTRRWSSRVRQP